MMSIERGRSPAGLNLPPPDFFDPVIEAYKANVDRTLLRENLKLTPAERMRKFERNMRMLFELRRAGRKFRDQAAAERAGSEPIKVEP